MAGSDEKGTNSPSLKDIYDALPTELCDRALAEHFLPRWLPDESELREGAAEAISLACTRLLQCHLLAQDPSLGPPLEDPLDRMHHRETLEFVWITELGLDKLPNVEMPTQAEAQTLHQAQVKAWEDGTHPTWLSPPDFDFDYKAMAHELHVERIVIDLVERFLAEILVPLVAARPRLVTPDKGKTPQPPQEPSSGATSVEGKLFHFLPKRQSNDKPPTR